MVVAYENPDIRQTGDGCLTLFHPGYGQTYHSMHGALQEARHVFLQEALVEERLKQGHALRILEVGFGLGLNFILTCQTAMRYAAPIHYVALEADLLSSGQLGQLHYAEELDIPALGEALLSWRSQFPDHMAQGRYEFQFGELIRLELHLGDACHFETDERFDAVYLDAFSPDQNPELWTEPFLKRLAKVMLPGGHLTTYSAKGSVRRALEAAGFIVRKRPGPPGKREMLLGIKPD
jgi:tRNA U34 5-methylaminomethyl-2-thiouridine-forming methyltransferase MnmC